MDHKKELLKENKKALQFLHHAHGFDFESNVFISSIPGRFTYKMIRDHIAANIGDGYTAALLIKPAAGYIFKELHYATMENGRFKIDHDRRALQWWKYNIHDFYGVGAFENIRKNLTKRVYIIAQKNELIRTPKPEPKPENNTRYNIAKNGVRYCGDGRGSHWIDKVELLPRDGKRGKIEFSPYNRFFGNEKRSDVITDHIDKSGYILRFRRMDLQSRARALKAERQRAAALAYDWSEREKKTAAGIAAAKKHIISMIEGAETYDDGKRIDAAAGVLRWMLWDFDALKEKSFASIEQKTRYFDSIDEKVNKILTGGVDQ